MNEKQGAFHERAGTVRCKGMQTCALLAPMAGLTTLIPGAAAKRVA